MKTTHNYITGPQLQKNSEGRIAEIKIGHTAKPSWKRYGDGFTTIEADRHVAGDWVQIRATERPDDGIARTVFITLTKAEAAALALFLTADASTFPEGTRPL